MSVIAGLRHRLRLERPLATLDDLGAPRLQWVLVAEVWGEVRHRPGEEISRAGAVAHARHARVRLRYRDDVEAGMRLVHHGRNLEILGAGDPTGAGRWLECDCRERPA